MRCSGAVSGRVRVGSPGRRARRWWSRGRARGRRARGSSRQPGPRCGRERLPRRRDIRAPKEKVVAAAAAMAVGVGVRGGSFLKGKGDESGGGGALLSVNANAAADPTHQHRRCRHCRGCHARALLPVNEVDQNLNLVEQSQSRGKTKKREWGGQKQPTTLLVQGERKKLPRRKRSAAVELLQIRPLRCHGGANYLGRKDLARGR